jgi:hypothetical protein
VRRVNASIATHLEVRKKGGREGRREGDTHQTFLYCREIVN